MKQSTSEAGIMPAATRGFFDVVVDPPGRFVNDCTEADAGLDGFDDPMMSDDEASVVEAGITDVEGAVSDSVVADVDGTVGDASGEPSVEFPAAVAVLAW